MRKHAELWDSEPVYRSEISTWIDYFMCHKRQH